MEKTPPACARLAVGSAILNQLDESYAYCNRLARRSASNFYFSFLLLPRAKRRAMYALYAFLRHVDDLGDDERIELAARRQALAQLRANSIVHCPAKRSIPCSQHWRIRPIAIKFRANT